MVLPSKIPVRWTRLSKNLKITPELRQILQKPIGKLIRSQSPRFEDVSPYLIDARKVISVGDATRENLLKIGISPSIQIFDFKEKRERKDVETRLEGREVRIENPPGCISLKAISALKEAMMKDESTIIVVDGEEDLLALPAIALAPLTSVILYGQPDEGLVIVKVDEGIRSIATKMLGSLDFHVDSLKY